MSDALRYGALAFALVAGSISGFVVACAIGQAVRNLGGFLSDLRAAWKRYAVRDEIVISYYDECDRQLVTKHKHPLPSRVKLAKHGKALPNV